jgi:aspartate carbamoyltransferase catalytic subunit
MVCNPLLHFEFLGRCLIPLSLIEIDPEVDFDSRRAVYFRQMRYGLFVSLAVFALVPLG